VEAMQSVWWTNKKVNKWGGGKRKEEKKEWEKSE
jgi:hypothetical protein